MTDPEKVLSDLGEVLRAAFPDPKAQIGAELARRVLSVLPEDIQRSTIGEVLQPLLGGDAHKRGAEVLGYYMAFAKHTRQGVSSFVGQLPMALIRLPERGPVDIETDFGICFAGDRKLYSAELVRSHYATIIRDQIGEVHLLTPPRYYGARFGAIATYVLHDIDGAVMGYVLEAGMATGEPMVTYIADQLDQPITRRSWYTPTPFSDARGYYRGHATFTEDGKPDELRVDVLKALGDDPHVTVEVHYEEVNEEGVALDGRWPAILTAQAAARVAAIGEKLGRPIGGGIENAVAPLLAQWARNTLSWIEVP